jgi:dTDP-4-dehydrorhamnose 3,5-epimerase
MGIFEGVVSHDIRPQSATFGKYHAVELRPGDGTMLFVPVGFAHGFLVLSEFAEVQYKCSAVYDSATEAGIRWDDPDLKVPWPLNGMEPLLSGRDRGNPSFAEFRTSVK